MKIAIFENEYDSVKGAFLAANAINFDSSFEIDNFPSSQSIPLDQVVNYDVIFIDIDLSSKSLLDGYSLIQKLQAISKGVKINEKIVILTGNNRIIESLKQKNINHSGIQMIIKPTDYIELTKVINNII